MLPTFNDAHHGQHRKTESRYNKPVIKSESLSQDLAMNSESNKGGCYNICDDGAVAYRVRMRSMGKIAKLRLDFGCIYELSAYF